MYMMYFIFHVKKVTTRSSRAWYSRGTYWWSDVIWETPMQILDCWDKQLCIETIPLFKTLWDHLGVEDATRELELELLARYPWLFRRCISLISRIKFLLSDGGCHDSKNLNLKFSYISKFKVILEFMYSHITCHELFMYNYIIPC